MGLLAAVEMWTRRDHDAEWKEWERRLEYVGDAVKDLDSVTLEDVCRVAAEFYDPDRQLVVRLGPDATNGSAQA
jgi:predicted Zn-dependent peptidase